MNKNNIILNPILSEKSHSLIDQFNQYVFKVACSSNKLEIKNAIEERRPQPLFPTPDTFSL